MKAPAILALDLGTSSTRSAIYDGKGQRLLATTAQCDYPLLTDQDGRAEISPVDLERAVSLSIKKTLVAWREVDSQVPIAAIGVSCFWHSLLGLDSTGSPLTPIYTWADSRCRNEALLLRKNSGEIRLHAETGCMMRASFWPAKLLWLRRIEPKLFRRVARWVSPAEWIQELWCGSATVSLSMASGTGLLDGKNLCWHRQLLRKCSLGENRLNPISDAPTKVRPGRGQHQAELLNVSWYPAIGDGAASNLGSGAVKAGLAAINVGTSAALRVVVESSTSTSKSLTPFGLFNYRVDHRRRLLGGAISNAGNLRAWALRELKLPSDPAEIEKLLAARTNPMEKLVVLPFWIAERAPTWPEHLPSAVIGITQATTALDILQALQESTYHRLAQIAYKLEKALRGRLSFIVSGGIQKSKGSMQRLANVLGRPVYASAEPEASLRGAACFALEKLGARPSAPKAGRAILPHAESTRRYAKARKQQILLEKMMREAQIHSLFE